LEREVKLKVKYTDLAIRNVKSDFKLRVIQHTWNPALRLSHEDKEIRLR
jgi:hypothetical protein